MCLGSLLTTASALAYLVAGSLFPPTGPPPPLATLLIVVAAKGSAVTALDTGDRVVVPFNVSCGTCWMCEDGLDSQCETTQNREQGMGASGRAVLACRCGVMLDLDDMCRPTHRLDRSRSGVHIKPICCARCATP